MTRTLSPLIALCALIVSGCFGQGIDPPEIRLRGEVGQTTTLPIILHLDGRPMWGAQFQLEVELKDVQPMFVLKANQPPRPEPTVEFTPPWAGDFKATLFVTFEGQEFRVPVIGEGQCPVNVGACALGDTSTTLQPAWTYQRPDGRPVISHTCAANEAGSLFCTEWYQSGVESPQQPSDLVALSPQGIEQWRRPLGARVGGVQAAGSELLVSFWEGTGWRVEIFSQADGSLLWTLGDGGLEGKPFVVTGADRLARVVKLEDDSSQVQVLDLKTGQILATASPTLPDPEATSVRPVGLMADGRGNVLVSWQCNVPFPGYVTTWAELFEPSGVPIALAEGKPIEHAYDVNIVAGNRFYAWDGSVIDATTLTEVGRLMWPLANPYYQTMVVSPAGNGFSSSGDVGVPDTCQVPILRSFDAAQQMTWVCHLSDVRNAIVSGLLLTEDDGVVAVTSRVDHPLLRHFDQQGNLRAQWRLNAPGAAAWNLSNGFAVSPTQVIAYVCPNATQGCWLAGYALPGVTLATHGWMMPQGNPGMTFRPR